jgi:hypothetical protein
MKKRAPKAPKKAVAKHPTSRAAKASKTAVIPPGFPSGVLEWMKGVIMAILSQDAPAVKEVISSVASSGNYPSTADFEVLESLPASEWTIVSCGLFPFSSPAANISKALKTDVVALLYDDNSDLLEYDFFRRGVLVESLEFCEAFPDCSYELIFGREPGKIAKKSPNLFRIHFVDVEDGRDTFVTFESTLIASTEENVRKRGGFIDQRFKELGIRLPSKR